MHSWRQIIPNFIIPHFDWTPRLNYTLIWWASEVKKSRRPKRWTQYSHCNDGQISYRPSGWYIWFYSYETDILDERQWNTDSSPQASDRMAYTCCSLACLASFYPNVSATLRSGLCCRKSVCLSSVMSNFRAPYYGVETSGNISSPAILWPPCKIIRRWSQENPSVRVLKHKSGSKIERCQIGYLIYWWVSCNISLLST